MVFPNNPNKGSGGNKAILSSVIKEFLDANIEITLLFIDDEASEYWHGNVKHVGFLRRKGLVKLCSMLHSIITLDLSKYYKYQQIDNYIKSKAREIDLIYFHHLYFVQGDLARFKKIICETHVIDSRVYLEGWKNNILVIKNLLLFFLYRRLEAKNAKRCDLSFTLNRKEQKRLDTFGHDAIYSPIDIKYQGPDQFQLRPVNRLVFFGSLNWLPNQQTVKYLLKFERQTTFFEKNGYEVHILGRGLPKKIEKLFPANGAIKLVGYVDDLDEYLLESAAVLAFMSVGEGIRLKILEAIALGLPVFANSEGIDGLEADHPCFVLSELEDLRGFFANNLLFEEHFRNDVIERSRRYLELNHSNSIRTNHIRSVSV